MINYIFFLCGYHAMNTHFLYICKNCCDFATAKACRGIVWGGESSVKTDKNASMMPASASPSMYIVIEKRLLTLVLEFRNPANFNCPKQGTAMNACDVY